jgi:hypothetical protein
MAIVRCTVRGGDKRPMTGRMDARDRRQVSPDCATPSTSRTPVRDTASLAGSVVLTPLLHGTILPPDEHEVDWEHDLAPAAGILMSVLLSGLFWLILGSML